jgi:hypothetical protein
VKPCVSEDGARNGLIKRTVILTEKKDFKEETFITVENREFGGAAKTNSKVFVTKHFEYKTR